MNLKKKSWSEVTLKDYDEIMEVVYDTDLSDDEKDIAIIAVLCEVPEEEIWNLPVKDVKMLKIQAMFIRKKFDYPKTLDFKKIKIGEWTCTVDTDFNNMTYAQFADYQTYLKEMDETKISPKNKAAILSCFFIPKGCKYGEGYDAFALQKAIRENVSILTYNSVWFFFLQKLRKQLKTTATSSASKMKAMSLLMKKTNPLKEKYLEAAKATMEIPNLLG